MLEGYPRLHPGLHDDIDALSTAVIAAFTIVLAWSTVRLWRETERVAQGADDQARQNAQSLKIAQQAANAAEDSAKAALATQRPWVRVELKSTGPLEFRAGKAAVLRMDSEFSNTGGTPAVRVVCARAIGVYPGKFPKPEWAKFVELAERRALIWSKTSTGVTVFPGIPITLHAGTGIPIADIDAAKAANKEGETRVYIAVAQCTSYTYGDGSKRGKTVSTFNVRGRGVGDAGFELLTNPDRGSVEFQLHEKELFAYAE